MRFTVKAKLFAAFGFVILLMAGMVGLGISSLGALNASLEDVLNGAAPRVQRSQAAETDMALLVRAEKNLLSATDQSRVSLYVTEMEQRRQAMAQSLDEGFQRGRQQHHVGNAGEKPMVLYD